MVNIVNEDLYSFNVRSILDKKTNLSKDELTVGTSNKLVRYTNRTRYPNQNQEEVNTHNGMDSSELPKLKASIRVIAKILSSGGEFIKDQIKHPTELYIYKDPNRSGRVEPQISIRCYDLDKENRNTVFLVAFPFNGMIQQIPQTNEYKIHKGLISTSARPFYFNGRKYRKILYLVIEPEMKYLNPNFNKKKEKIDITFESFAIYKNKEQQEVTNHEKFTISVLNQSGEYTSNWEYETLDYPKFINIDTTVPWTTFGEGTYSPKYNNNTQSNGYKPNYQKRTNTTPGMKQHVPAYPRIPSQDSPKGDDYYITTNKNGIRKEVPKRNHRRAPNPNRSTEKTNHDFESMLKTSLNNSRHRKDDDYDEVRPKKGNGKRKGKKR